MAKERELELTESDFFIQSGVGIFVTITIIGVIMALKWKNRNFEGSPSKGKGWLPRRNKKE